jgi:hypothetical protein
VARNKKIILISAIVSIVLLVLCYCVLLLSKEVTKVIKNTQEYSAFEALKTELVVALDIYYREKGRYPASIYDLELLFEDGASKEMLDQFKYESTGDACSFEYIRNELWTNEFTRVHYEFYKGREIATTGDHCKDANSQ